MKRGFTIIELLAVIAIIGVLLGLSTSAVTGAMQKARSEKASAGVKLINQGAAVYYAQKGKWPGPIGSKVENGASFTLEKDQEYYTLTATEVRETVREMVLLARDGTPVMDISGLFVSRKAGNAGSKDFGMDFMEAVRGTRKSRKKMTTSEMYFGYPESAHGYFRHFVAKYYPKTDQLVFETQKE